MSVLCLGSELQGLAARLADGLAQQERGGDFFAPTTVVVPNRYVRKWLRLWLARRLGISINLRCLDLEEALWELLRAADPTPHAVPPEPLDEQADRLLVLSVLLEEREPSLAVLQRYLQLHAPPLSRLSCRRAWQLADRLGALLREYEYHRHSLLIEPWLRQQPGLLQAGSFHPQMERAQRTLFGHVAGPDDGRRARLARHSGRNLQTFAQYAAAVLAQPPAARPDRVVHFFGLTHLSELHARVIAWLGAAFDVRVYHPNVVASRARGTPTAKALQSMADALRDEPGPDELPDRGKELLRRWGRAGVEALGRMAGLLADGGFGVEVLPAAPAVPVLPRRRRGGRRPTATVLARLHDHLLGRAAGSTRRLAQDTSVQIVACPGIVREVETVHNSILDNLRHNPALRQTDVAVLVTDMPRYRPVLQAVFERPPRRVQYNLVDFSAAGLSVMAQALLGMLDLALESFTRDRVFAVLLNPCFLARLGVDRAQAATWLGWAETLGVYDGWDAGEKHERGYARSPFYAWRLALQRLRLGRYMEVATEDADEPAPRFGHVLPFADIHCADREHLDAFCRAVETLLPALDRLRRPHTTGQRWAAALARLVHDFLAVPADRPEEAEVRTEILAAIERLALWDHLRPGHAPPAGLPLALVREYVQTQLEALEGSRGEYLTGGVTLAALQPMRPVPFQVIYVVGLDAELFPGSNALSSFDLRGGQREPGDVRPAEERTYQLLENVVAAQQKLYLLYNRYDAQRDQELLPSVPVQQLQRYLGQRITRGPFEAVEVPPHGDDDRYFHEAAQPEYQDVLVQYRDADRFLAFAAASEQGRLALDLHQQEELRARRAELAADFTIVPEPSATAPAVPVTVAVRELSGFLRFPARESLRRHLGVADEEASDAADEEPLVTPDRQVRAMVRQALGQLVRRAVGGDLEQALREWPDQFGAAFADARLRCRVPEDAFGDLDAAALRQQLHERIHGKGAIESFLRVQADIRFCGPALLGESVMPVGARMRFPALRLRPGHELPADAGSEVRVVGSTPFAWFKEDTFEVLVITTSAAVDGRELCVPMLEPLLLYLALLANPEPNAKAIASGPWLARRHFHLYLAHANGIQTWTYPAGAISREEALHYLVQLTRDLLDPEQLDLLPFELVMKGNDVHRVYDERGPGGLSAEEYQQIMEERLAEEREKRYQPLVQVPLVVDLAGARVPGDALAKVQRRFRLLDRGPAQVRADGRSRRSTPSRG